MRSNARLISSRHFPGTFIFNALLYRCERTLLLLFSRVFTPHTPSELALLRLQPVMVLPVLHLVEVVSVERIEASVLLYPYIAPIGLEVPVTIHNRALNYALSDAKVRHTEAGFPQRLGGDGAIVNGIAGAEYLRDVELVEQYVKENRPRVIRQEPFPEFKLSPLRIR